jgi:hypothetical protein
VLQPWPEGYISNSKLFFTYDAEAVAEREADRRSRLFNEVGRACLLPLYPFLGLAWSGTQTRLMRFGFQPRLMTGVSIFTGTIFLVVYATFGRTLLGNAALGLIFEVAMLFDVIVRSVRYKSNDRWAGGFLEWLFPMVSEEGRRADTPTPGFFASLEEAFGLALERKSPSAQPAKDLLWVPPLIQRELRNALRKQKPVRRRLVTAGICFAGVIYVMMISSSLGARAGLNLHRFFCLVGLYIVLRSPQRIAGILAAERREQTLGLLFLSGLSALEIFASKALSAALILFTDLLAITPMLALPFFLGGISFDLFLATVFCLPGLLFFVLSVSLLASALSEDEGAALLGAIALALGICAAPPILWAVFEHNSSTVTVWLRFCPAYGPWLVFERFGSSAPAEFWANLGTTLIWSFICLGAAAWVLSRSWRQTARPTRRARWSLFLAGIGRGQQPTNSWLDKNPFTWLALRNLRLPAVCLMVVILIGGGWIGWAFGSATKPSVLSSLAVAAFLNLVLRCFGHYAAAGNLGMARRDGTYELLLTTPLYPSDIVRGQIEALRRQFLGVTITVLAIDLFMMILPLPARHWDVSSLLSYLCVWGCILFWTWDQNRNQRGPLLSMWISLNSARPLFAVCRSFGFDSGASAVWIVLLLLSNFEGRWLQDFPSGSVIEVVIVGLTIAIFSTLRARFRESALYVERRLIVDFREIVREPVPEPNDSRFKQWIVQERFPWGVAQ